MANRALQPTWESGDSILNLDAEIGKASPDFPDFLPVSCVTSISCAPRLGKPAPGH
jgi:hypothetical protein